MTGRSPGAEMLACCKEPSMRLSAYVTAWALIGWLSGALALPSSAAEAMPKQRQFRFTYGARLSRLPRGSQLRLWIPKAPTNAQQQVEIVRRVFPGSVRETREARFGNALYYLETRTSDETLALEVEYEVRRREERGLEAPRQLLPVRDRQLLLSPSARVPVGGKPLELLRGEPPKGKLEVARWIYESVDAHMRYDKSQPGFGNGDAVWACESGFGNCSDFHSLFISLARAHNMPAYFEIGFPLPDKRGAGAVSGYHCWAYAWVDGHGWLPVDISEADKQPELREYYFGNLSENRVALSIGRDLRLEPPQQGGPINFFVYPYAEVDGKPWPNENIQLDFSFRDL